MAQIRGSLVRAALAAQIKARVAAHPPNATPDVVAYDLAGFALERLEAMVLALEWYRDATADEFVADRGARAARALGEPPR